MSERSIEHLRRWNDTARPYPRDASLTGLFEAQVRRTPDAPAVTDGTVTLTYRDLSARADALAHALREEHGVGVGTPVPLLLERSPEAIVGVWGVLKAGGAYVPLDPDEPADRLRGMADRLDAPCVITRDRWRDRLPAAPAVVVDEPLAPAPEPVVSPAAATDPAYIMFTSGSTGAPKAVVVPHRGPVRLVVGTDYVDLGPQDVVLATTNPTFDISCFEIFGAHLHGGLLVLPDPETLLSPSDLAAQIERHHATVLWLTAGLFHQLGFAEPGMFGPLRYLIAGGDTVSPECVRAVLAAAPPRHLVNGYGPTENASFSSAHHVIELGEDARTVPIGRPIANSTCYVLDEDGNPCEPGQEGELYVGGDGVAIGYLGDPERTAERFLPDRFAGRDDARMYRTGDRALWRRDGVLEYLGRLDRQVQIRGYRVEPAEVEAAVTAHPDVQDAKVAVDDSGSDDRSLVVWAAPRESVGDAGRRPFARRLRGFLQDRLPHFMLPARIGVTDRLPLGRTGKVDPAAVRELTRESGERPAGDPPDGDTERAVARVWADLLGTGPIGRTDDFFDLGGQSLHLVRAVATVRERLDLQRVPGREMVRILLDTPVLSEYAARLDAVRAGREDPGESAVDFRREAEPDPGLRFRASGLTRAAAPDAVLLTGATGYVGAFLLRRLLDAADAEVFCLVRADGAEDGLRRIGAALRRSGLSLSGLSERVRAVPGDLAERRLGMDDPAFEELAARVGVVLHNGAHVNFLYPYARLAAANVGSVRELLALATRHHLKDFHYVSSVAVLAGLGTQGVDRAAEDGPLGDPRLLGQGYAETKWVAETMLRAAADEGLPLSVYRPHEITGPREGGAQNTGTLMSAFVKAVVETGTAPDVPMPLDFVPVDHTAEVVTHLVLHEPPEGHVYHVVNPAPASLSLLAERAAVLGYRVRALPYEEWTRAMAEHVAEDPAGPLAAYLPLFRERSAGTGLSVFESYFSGNMPEPDRANTARAAGHRCPPVDAALLDAYLRSLLDAGFLRPPSRD
ncbi:non-ribosomal peptide synthetase [Actinomadura flavalba]|uniref:non-ribosomal peptide synthetase n=1 Tax=Actinomadura flavalba TaxID=1120938 RepID=UPI0003719584|nr:amino acid adenylation domain-containing protein [Actinomadura flavalba]